MSRVEVLQRAFSVVAILAATFYLFVSLQPPATVRLNLRDYQWEAVGLDGNTIRKIDSLAVPANSQLRLVLTSTDQLYILSYQARSEQQFELGPGAEKKLDLRFKESGQFLLEGEKFCGFTSTNLTIKVGAVREIIYSSH